MDSQTYPAQLQIDAQERLGRASTIFRIILIIPIALLLNFLVSGGESTTVVVNRSGDVVSQATSWGSGIIGTLFFVTLLMILFRKRYPRWWFDFNLALHRFIARVLAYLFLLTDKYPSTEDEQNVHLDLKYPDAQTELMRGMPLVKWLQARGVRFQYGTEVTDVDFALQAGRKQATRIHWMQDGQAGGVDLGADDLVFMTIGSLTENSDNGDHHNPAKLNLGPAPAWDLWRRIAAKDPAFGRPEVFGSHIPETKWESATVTTLDQRIPKYIQNIAKRDPFSGKVVTGGIVFFVNNLGVNRQILSASRLDLELMSAMDALNRTQGKNTVYFASAHHALDTAPMRIAFNRIPDLDTER